MTSFDHGSDILVGVQFSWLVDPHPAYLLGKSVALLVVVARRTNNRKVVGSMPANVLPQYCMG